MRQWASDGSRSCLSDQPVGSGGHTRVLTLVSPTPTPHPMPGPCDGRCWLSSPGRGRHSLGQGHVSCVQQKLLPAVGAHQPHRLLVEANLPETTWAWPLPGRGGSAARRPGQGREGGNTPGGHQRGPEEEPSRSWGLPEVSSGVALVPSTHTEASLRVRLVPLLGTGPAPGSQGGWPGKPCACGGPPTPSLNSPTHSQVHCKKRPLPPGMASLWPLREETPMPITPLASCPSPARFLRPGPSQRGPLLAPRREDPSSPCNLQ